MGVANKVVLKSNLVAPTPISRRRTSANASRDPEYYFGKLAERILNEDASRRSRLIAALTGDAARAERLDAVLGQIEAMRPALASVERSDKTGTYARNAARLLRAVGSNVDNVANGDIAVEIDALLEQVPLSWLVGFVYQHVQHAARPSRDRAHAKARRTPVQEPLGNRNTGAAYRRSAAWLAAREVLRREAEFQRLLTDALRKGFTAWQKQRPDTFGEARDQGAAFFRSALFDLVITNRVNERRFAEVFDRLEDAFTLLVAYPPAEVSSALPAQEAVQPPPLVSGRRGRWKLDVVQGLGQDWFDAFWAVAVQSRYAPAVAVVTAAGVRSRELHTGVEVARQMVPMNGQPVPALLITVKGAKTNMVAGFEAATTIERRTDKGLGQRSWPVGIDAADTRFLWDLFDRTDDGLAGYACHIERLDGDRLLVRWKPDKDPTTATKMLGNAFVDLHRRAFGDKGPILTPSVFRHLFHALVQDVQAEDGQPLWAEAERAAFMGHVSPETGRASYGKRRQAKSVRSKRPTILGVAVTDRSPRVQPTLEDRLAAYQSRRAPRDC